MILTILCWFAVVFGLGMITYPIFREWQWKHSKLGKHAIKIQREIEEDCRNFARQMDEEAKRGISPEHLKQIEDGVNRVFDKRIKPHFDELIEMQRELNDINDYNNFVIEKCKEMNMKSTPEDIERIKEEIKAERQKREATWKYDKKLKEQIQS